MKTLYLIRHAKSDWGNEIIIDIDRPLNSRGYSDANRMSRLLKRKGIIPDGIITSPAVRAVTTALIFSRNLNFNPMNVYIHSQLYNTSKEQYLKTIGRTTAKINSLMLFAHNPIITECANSLTTKNIESLPTCAIVGITYKCNDWEEFVHSQGELALYDFPKNNV